ncbi:Thylakoid lumenal protein [Chlorella vulgaris]
MALAASLSAAACTTRQQSRAATRSRGHTTRCAATPYQPLATSLKAAGAAAAGMAAALVLVVQPASADLNKYEAAAGGEFNIGTARQYGEADVKGQDFSNQDLQRSNFTAADARDASFKNSKLQASYFMKSVLARANMENADLSDALMDRSVIVDANLRNAILQRAILTRSDLSRADIYGADFTNALVDKTQQMAMCKYADGVNTVTGVDTRKSLACGSSRRFKAAAPSDPEGPQVSESEKAAFNASTAVYRQ